MLLLSNFQPCSLYLYIFNRLHVSMSKIEIYFAEPLSETPAVLFWKGSIDYQKQEERRSVHYATNAVQKSLS